MCHTQPASSAQTTWHCQNAERVPCAQLSAVGSCSEHTGRRQGVTRWHTHSILSLSKCRQNQQAGESHHLLSSPICGLLLQTGHFPPQAKQQSDLFSLSQMGCSELSNLPLTCCKQPRLHVLVAIAQLGLLLQQLPSTLSHQAVEAA